MFAASGRDATGSPAMMRSSSTQQRTVGASGPIESRVNESGNAPSRGMRACVGLNPVMPHSAEGMRTEPPVSEPIVAIAMPSVTLTAPPDVEPPGMRALARSHGFNGVP
jgi:hypothetical protein